MEDPFDLVIDAGNSRVKIGWAKNGRIVRTLTVDRIDRALVDQWLINRPSAVVIGSVGGILIGFWFAQLRRAPTML